MTNPYQILGVSSDASDEDIKKAYRKLSRRYHPDANVNNPNKDQAEAKFKEVQQAYDQIMKQRTGGYDNPYGGSSYGGNPYGNQSGGGNPYGDFGDFGGFGDFWGSFGGFDNRQHRSYGNEESPHLQAAANYIRNRHYREALNVLNNITERTARWYYYSAQANYGIGNNVQALEHAKTALQMEPDNIEYDNLVRMIESGESWYQTRRNPYGGAVMNGNDCCMKLCIANMICNLCCGGRVFCC